jgi:hypothetical protein
MGLLELFRRRSALSDSVALADFLDSRSAFMVQKCVFEYARARSGLLSAKLFKEAAFAQGIEVTRWRNYPLCLQSMTLMAEHALRSHAGADESHMREGLSAVIGEICRRYPVPDGFEPGFWENAEARITRRLFQAGLAAPHAVKDIPRETAREFFDNLPFHPDVRASDYELITNNLRVNLCRAYDDFVSVADFRMLAASLTHRPPMHAGHA